MARHYVRPEVGYLGHSGNSSVINKLLIKTLISLFFVALFFGIQPVHASLPEVTKYQQQTPQPEPSPFSSAANRFARDRPGNTIAVVVLIGMLISTVWIAASFVSGSSTKNKPWPNWVIPILAILGLGVAIYLTYIETTRTDAICGPVGDCNSVQQSSYAKLFGLIPVGLLGAVGYILILAIWLLSLLLPEVQRKKAWLALWMLAWLGVLFSIYLTFLEPFVIGATCMWCITSAMIMTLLLWATTPLAKLATMLEDDGASEEIVEA